MAKTAFIPSIEIPASSRYFTKKEIADGYPWINLGFTFLSWRRMPAKFPGRGGMETFPEYYIRDYGFFASPPLI
jgi:hypothetical protein